MAEATLDTLFHASLRDTLYAERKALQLLRKQVRAARSPELKDAFERHREETEGQVERLQQVFELIGKRATGKSCPSIDGIAEEAEEMIAEFGGSPVGDAALIAGAQAGEHYEICRYGTLASWARQMGQAEAERLLRETLEEEVRADQLLTELAERAINPEGAAGEGAQARG